MARLFTLLSGESNLKEESFRKAVDLEKQRKSRIEQ